MGLGLWGGEGGGVSGCWFLAGVDGGDTSVVVPVDFVG